MKSDYENYIRFIDWTNKFLFNLPNGGKIRIVYENGESFERTCKYIDGTHFKDEFGVYHIREFAQWIKDYGAKVERVE